MSVSSLLRPVAFEAGTPPIAGAAGLGAALNWMLHGKPRPKRADTSPRSQPP